MLLCVSPFSHPTLCSSSKFTRIRPSSCVTSTTCAVQCTAHCIAVPRCWVQGAPHKGGPHRCGCAALEQAAHRWARHSGVGWRRRRTRPVLLAPLDQG